MDRLVECVPNFSEGRDSAVIEAIAGAIRSVSGVKLLNVDPGADFNRTVYTFVGPPEEVLEAAFQAARIGTCLIDMTKHKGEHARNGALDVVPFIPISGVTYEDCTELAMSFGERMWNELRVPMYLYARSARSPSRVRLPDIRKGEYEALPEKMKDPDFKPDYGDPVFVPRSGVTATGARPILIAYNINLASADKGAAQEISGRIRESGYAKKDGKGEKVIGPDGKPVKVPGRFKGVQAGGMMYDEGTAQISMNLLDYEEVNLHDVFEAVREEAEGMGMSLRGSEIVGLVPKAALVKAGRFYAGKEGLDLSNEQEFMELAIERLGLNELYEFKADRKVIEHLIMDQPALAGSTLRGFLDELASNSPAPGGGSVAALAGSAGAALVEMVCQLTLGKEKYRDVWGEMKGRSRSLGRLRDRLLALVDEDTQAFNDVMDAFKMPKDTDEQKSIRSQAIQQGYRRAISTPIETAQRCIEVLEIAPFVAEKGNSSSITDVAVGAEMASTGLDGALLNIRINLGSVKDEGYRKGIEDKMAEMVARRNVLMGSIHTSVGNNM